MTGSLMTLCLLLVLIARQSGVRALPSPFMQHLRRDMRLVNAQWTWREVYPGRDTMSYALVVLRRRDESGFFQQISEADSRARLDWTTAAAPTWSGSIYRDNDVPPPHVYAIVLHPPAAAMTLGEAILQFGTPLGRPTRLVGAQRLCFQFGLCLTFAMPATPPAGRLSPHAAVISISYLPTAIVKRTVGRAAWQGLRRYPSP